jgi:hypothetical protein
MSGELEGAATKNVESGEVCSCVGFNQVGMGCLAANKFIIL